MASRASPFLPSQWAEGLPSAIATVTYGVCPLWSHRVPWVSWVMAVGSALGVVRFLGLAWAGVVLHLGSASSFLGLAWGGAPVPLPSCLFRTVTPVRSCLRFRLGRAPRP